MSYLRGSSDYRPRFSFWGRKLFAVRVCGVATAHIMKNRATILHRSRTLNRAASTRSRETCRRKRSLKAIFISGTVFRTVNGSTWLSWARCPRSHFGTARRWVAGGPDLYRSPCVSARTTLNYNFRGMRRSSRSRSTGMKEPRRGRVSLPAIQ